ncbi:hypothetical protein Afil01_19780 [Actinorhabdospora filicis]|uniref:Uncharacterized protein n=1 Tax=Actinorhabdospora filicis TaxID=1785913 RepID=A0A9W6SM88_9ACTN|nr:hypothetical protein [Actinorhabdospora filicis]GLZ77171.1 hypothetical protein Afil01_19780 [Actinorhabdospora filicis]
MSGFAVPRGRGPAPLVARIAAALLFAAAALTAVWTAVSTAAFASYPDRMAGAEGGGTFIAWAALAALGLACLAAAGGFVLCALAMTRGNAAGWYGAFGLVLALVVVVVINRVSDDGGLPVALLSLAAENAGHDGDSAFVLASAPGWFETYWLVQDCVTGLVAVVAGFLLMLPPSVDHFTRRPPVAGGYGVPWG